MGKVKSPSINVQECHWWDRLPIWQTQEQSQLFPNPPENFDWNLDEKYKATLDRLVEQGRINWESYRNSRSKSLKTAIKRKSPEREP